MTRSLVAAVLGLVLGIVVPFFWASPLPVLLGAALLVVAGFLAQRAALAVAGIVAAALLAVSPALVNRYRNRQGIAWTVAAGERLQLAEGGLAVTSADSVLRGRKLRTGDRMWELRLPDAGQTLRVWRAGPLVLTTGFDETLRAVDAASGKVRWESPGRVSFLGVSDGEHIAVTRCGRTIAECEVQSLSLADGRVAWRAPVTSPGEYLGVPLLDDGAPQRDLPPWTASFVLVTDEDDRWEARDLATGRVLETGTQREGETAILGDILVRSDEAGAITATNVQTGATAWSRPAGDGRPSRSPVEVTDSLAAPEGQLVLSGDGDPIDSVRIGDRLRTLDIRTGKPAEQPVDVEFDLVDVLAPDRPTGKQPVVFWFDYEDDTLSSRIFADGRRYDRDATRNVDLAPGLIGFGHAGSTWGTGLERVYEVFDRASGERLVRYAGEDVSVYALGDALVLTEGDDDDAPQRVIVTP